MDCKLSAYDYCLPKELIAQNPLEARDKSRLLVLEKDTGQVSHKKFSDIIEYLNAGDCLVINRTKVTPARLFGKKKSGGKVEVLFLNRNTGPKASDECTALTRPAVDVGKKIIFPDRLVATVIGRTQENETVLKLSGADLNTVLNKHGVMPLPNYIKRDNVLGSKLSKADKSRYQTVYAKEEGSIAAPTAGFHFTAELLDRIKSKGIDIAEVILHVGWGTFKPIVCDDISDHKMLPENFQIDEKAAKSINQCIKNNKKIIAVGTTTVRTLESAGIPTMGNSNNGYTIAPQSAETSIFIYPGHKFKAVKTLLTNFHQPKSTPLLMACAFAGKENIFNAYKEAISNKYRFFSYGDAMLII